MIEQPRLDGTPTTIGSNGRPLTPRQQRALDLVRSSPGGITADELGAQVHADKGRHHPDDRCTWCASTGKQLLESVALKPLVIRRRASSRYECRDGSTPPAVADRGSQLSELPGETFEDLFGGAA